MWLLKCFLHACAQAITVSEYGSEALGPLHSGKNLHLPLFSVATRFKAKHITHLTAISLTHTPVIFTCIRNGLAPSSTPIIRTCISNGLAVLERQSLLTFPTCTSPRLFNKEAGGRHYPIRSFSRLVWFFFLRTQINNFSGQTFLDCAY